MNSYRVNILTDQEFTRSTKVQTVTLLQYD